MDILNTNIPLVSDAFLSLSLSLLLQQVELCLTPLAGGERRERKRVLVIRFILHASYVSGKANTADVENRSSVTINCAYSK